MGGWGAHNCGAQPYEEAWGYVNAGSTIGPQNWATLSSTYFKCDQGQFQSPIRLPWDGSKGEMEAFYHNLTFSEDTVIPGYITVDNGRHYTARMPAESKMHFKAGDHRYDLKNITLHTPSEHMIGTRRYDMEMQLNHEDSFGNLASVAILFTAVDDLRGGFYEKDARNDF